MGTDGSAGSREALRWAVAHVELSGAAVQAVMACQLPEVYSMVDLLAYQLHDEGAALRFNSGGFQVVKPASSAPTRPPRSGRTSAPELRQCEVRWV